MTTGDTASLNRWTTSREFRLQCDDKCSAGLEPLDHITWRGKNKQKKLWLVWWDVSFLTLVQRPWSFAPWALSDWLCAWWVWISTICSSVKCVCACVRVCMCVFVIPNGLIRDLIHCSSVKSEFWLCPLVLLVTYIINKKPFADLWEWKLVCWLLPIQHWVFKNINTHILTDTVPRSTCRGQKRAKK